MTTRGAGSGPRSRARRFTPAGFSIATLLVSINIAVVDRAATATNPNKEVPYCHQHCRGSVRQGDQYCPSPSAASVAALFAPCQAFESAMGREVSKQEAVKMGLLRSSRSRHPSLRRADGGAGSGPRLLNSNRRRKEADREGEQHKATEYINCHI